jgi:hypothetical protein
MFMNTNCRIALGTVLALATGHAAAQCETWQFLGNQNISINISVRAFTYFNDQLIAAGDDSVQRWTGETWEPLGDELYDSVGITSLCVFHNILYAGGSFQDRAGQVLNGIARWDGSQWQPVDTELGTAVVDLMIFDDQLAAIGYLKFDGIVSNVALWNGTRWSPIAAHFSGISIDCMTQFAGELVVAGRFDSVENVPTKNIAMWNGREWHALGSGLDLPNQYSSVASLCEYGHELYAGKDVIYTDGTPINVVWRWDGTEWRAAGGPFGIPDAPSVGVRKLMQFNGELIAAGGFSRVEGRIAYGIARWNGTRWRELGAGLPTTGIGALTLYQDDLLVGSIGGDFHVWHDPPGECLGACCYQDHCSLTTIEDCEAAGGVYHGSGVPCSEIACEGECQTWQPFTHGLYWDDKDGSLNTIFLYNGSFFAIGRLRLLNGPPGWFNILISDGLTWQPFQTGLLPFSPRAALALGRDLYIAGTQILHFDGTRWEMLPGVFSSANTLHEFRGRLVVGGQFTTIEGTVCNNIALWDGTNWQTLLGGLTGDSASVNALAIYNDELIAAGHFDFADGQPAASIAAWNGKSWHPLGAGVSDRQSTLVTGLAEYGQSLIVGGIISRTGDQLVNNIAAWDGSHWSASFELPTYFDSSVSLALFHNQLIASATWDGFQNPVRRWNINRNQWEPMVPAVLANSARVVATDQALIAFGTFLVCPFPLIHRLAIWSDCVGPCRTDFNADGFINIDDLMSVMSSWGECPSPCAQDVYPPKGDQIVNVDDLIAVLMTWGPCP